MRLVLWCGSLALLTACAANEVRLEYAGAVATQAKRVTDMTTQYVVAVQARRREANIALVASDPGCRWGTQIVINLRWNGTNSLCDISNVPAEDRLPISLQPISDEALKAVTESVAGLAAYEGALTEVLDAKPLDAKSALDEAISTLSTASTDLGRITGSKVMLPTGIASALTGDTAKAVTTLIGTLAAMQQTAMKVREIRSIVAKTNTVVIFSNLRSTTSDLSNLQEANSDVQMLASLQNAYADDVVANRLDFGQRSQRLHEIAGAQDDVSTLRKERLDVIAKAIDKLATADADLRNGLAGHWSAEAKREIARRNRKNILELLSELAALFPVAAAA